MTCKKMMHPSCIERSNDSTASEDESIRSSSRIGRPAAWARFAFQVFLASVILFTSLALMIYDVAINGKPTETTTVWLPIVTFIVGLFFNTKHAKDKKPKPVVPAGHVDHDQL